MQGKNRYFRSSHLSEANFKQIVPILRTITGLENRRAERYKPSDNQSVIIQTTDPNRSALWRIIALLRHCLRDSGTLRVKSTRKSSRTPPRSRYRLVICQTKAHKIQWCSTKNFSSTH